MAGEAHATAIGTAMPRYNRKDPRPSADMHEPDGGSYRCPWIEDSITVHSDGNVSCGLDDPHAMRSFGNIATTPVEVIFANPEYTRLRDRLRQGYRCRGCSLYSPVEATARPAERPALPTTLVVETTVRCNLRCGNDACVPNNDAGIRTRDRDDLPIAWFHGVVSQLRDALSKVYFFNYGDPFMHKGAEDMLLHLREACPRAATVTSTNAIPLASMARAEKVIAADLDHIVVTLSGITQDSYAAYHVRGRVDLALKGLRNLCEARARRPGCRTKIVWRYLLFRWNDSDEEVGRALAMAEEFGVDQFSLYLTHLPADAASFRFSPGTASYAKFFDHIDLAHGYTCEAPAEDGMYGPEEFPEVGPVRWTSRRARIEVAGSSPYIRLRLATLHPRAAQAPQRVTVTAPWGRVAIGLDGSGFQAVTMRVPWSYRRKGTVPLDLEVLDTWSPAEYSKSADLRTLGALFRDEDCRLGGWRYELRWLAEALRAGSVRHRGREMPAASLDRPYKRAFAAGRFKPFEP